jgi:hypothetical protein
MLYDFSFVFRCAENRYNSLPDGYHTDGGLTGFQGEPWGGNPPYLHGREVPNGPGVQQHVVDSLGHPPTPSTPQSLTSDVKPNLNPAVLTPTYGKYWDFQY